MIEMESATGRTIGNDLNSKAILFIQVSIIVKGAGSRDVNKLLSI